VESEFSIPFFFKPLLSVCSSLASSLAPLLPLALAQLWALKLITFCFSFSYRMSTKSVVEVFPTSSCLLPSLSFHKRNKKGGFLRPPRCFSVKLGSSSLVEFFRLGSSLPRAKRRVVGASWEDELGDRREKSGGKFQLEGLGTCLEAANRRREGGGGLSESLSSSPLHMGAFPAEGRKALSSGSPSSF